MSKENPEILLPSDKTSTPVGDALDAYRAPSVEQLIALASVDAINDRFRSPAPAQKSGDEVWWLGNTTCPQLAEVEKKLGALAMPTQMQLLEQACSINDRLGMRSGCHSVRINVPFFTCRPPIYNRNHEIIGFDAGNANLDYSKVYYGEIPVVLPANDETQAMAQRKNCKQTLGWQMFGRVCKDSDAELGKLSTYSGGKAELFNKLGQIYNKQGPGQGEIGFFFPGFSTNFRDSVVMAAIAQRDWGIPVVLDSWPSRDHKGPIAYNADEWSISTDYRLATRPVLNEAIRRFPANDIDMIGFSMGSRPVTSFALECANEYEKTGLAVKRLGRVIEAEADQPEVAFKGDLEKIAEGAQDVTLYVSDEHTKGWDAALKLSKIYHGGEMPLGLAGPELYSTLPQTIQNVRSIVVNELNTPPFYHEDHDKVMAAYARFGVPGLAQLKLCLEDTDGQARYFRIHKGAKKCKEIGLPVDE